MMQLVDVLAWLSSDLAGAKSQRNWIMTLPPYLSAFLSLATLSLAFFCWRRRHLAVARLLAVFSLCLALALTFEVPALLAHKVSDPARPGINWSSGLVVSKLPWLLLIALMLSWRPLPWPASWQRLLTVGLALLDLCLPVLVSTGVIGGII